MPLTETLAVTRAFMNIMAALEIPCIVGGSVASSMMGVPRATQDVDVVARLFLTHVPSLLQRLEGHYYIDEGAVRDAIKRNTAFNVIHLKSMFKIDVFICGDDPLRNQEMDRARTWVIDEENDLRFAVADPADIILQKLLWYEMGERVSERQWQDVLNVIKVNGPALDRTYLDHWAKKKNLTGLLEKAFAQAQGNQ